jgi:hypothetical protein
MQGILTLRTCGAWNPMRKDPDVMKNRFGRWSWRLPTTIAILLTTVLASNSVVAAGPTANEAAGAAVAATAGQADGRLAAGRSVTMNGFAVAVGSRLADRLTIGTAGARIGIRQPAAVGRAVTHRNGTLISATSDPGMTAAAQVTGEGVRLLTVLEGAAAPTRIVYDLVLPAGAELVANDAGGFFVADPGTGGVPDVVYAEIKAPWAVDATGRRLSTVYTATGSTLVQHVDHHGAAYPVVADPYVTIGRYIYVTYRKAEVRTLLDNYAGAHALAAAACTRIPHAAASAVCIAGVAAHALGMYQTFRRARSQRECARMIFTVSVPPVWAGSYVYDC